MLGVRRDLVGVQYHTMSCITAAVAATEEEQVSPHHPCVYNRTAVQQITAEKPIHQQEPTIPPCVYNDSTAVLQQNKK